MFYITKEGDVPKNGFNFYPLSDPHNFGGKLRIGLHIFSLRYSTYLGKWKAYHYKGISEDAAKKIMEEWYK